jgi:hypothetical protein
MPPPLKIRIVCYASLQFAKSRFVPDHVDNLLALIMMNPWAGMLE